MEPALSKISNFNHAFFGIWQRCSQRAPSCFLSGLWGLLCALALWLFLLASDRLLIALLGAISSHFFRVQMRTLIVHRLPSYRLSSTTWLSIAPAAPFYLVIWSRARPSNDALHQARRKTAQETAVIKTTTHISTTPTTTLASVEKIGHTGQIKKLSPTCCCRERR